MHFHSKPLPIPPTLCLLPPTGVPAHCLLDPAWKWNIRKQPSIGYRLVVAILLFLIVPGLESFAQCNDFVRIKGKKFKCGQSDFFAVVANYFIEVTWSPGANLNDFTFPNFYPSRQHSYFPDNTFSQADTQAKAYSAVRKDFQALKSKGFNAIRLYGATSYQTINALERLGQYSVFIPYTDPLHTPLLLNITENIINAAAAEGLKVIVLTGSGTLTSTNIPAGFNASYVNYLEQFAIKFKHNPALLGVDLINEPSLHGGWWPKSYVCNLVKSWNNAIKNNSQILTTIGLWEIGGMKWWDPNLMHIDFASLHNYPQYPSTIDKAYSFQTELNMAIDRIKSDYWWYKNNVTIPWIIGETGLSAHPINLIYPLNGYDLRFMSGSGTSDLLGAGRSLVIVARIGANSNLHIRIFDATGNKVIDKPEADLVDGKDRTDLKALVSTPPFPATNFPCWGNQKIIEQATSCAGHTLLKNLWDQGPSAGTIQDQADYLNATLNASRDYGAAGYSWWEYSDQDPHQYANSCGGPYWGLALSHDADTNTSIQSIQWKPAISHITSFNPNNIGTAIQPPNYYNYYNINTGKYASGRVTSAPNIGIRDAMVIVVDEFSRYWFTYTDANGYFTVHSQGIIKKLTVTATECKEFDSEMDSTNTNPTLTGLLYQLVKVNRTNTRTYANQDVYNATVNDYAVIDAYFSNNYNIFSGNFSITAGSLIKLNAGFLVNMASILGLKLGRIIMIVVI